eukprot:1139613-Pelagomonas_calceolata.AAC.6
MPEGQLTSAFQNLTAPDDYNLSDELPTLSSMQLITWHLVSLLPGSLYPSRRLQAVTAKRGRPESGRGGQMKNHR